MLRRYMAGLLVFGFLAGISVPVLGQDVSLDAHLSRLDALTPADLHAVARRALGEEPVAIEVLPARGLGKLFAALKFVMFRRL